MISIILSPATVLLYGIACWSYYKKPAILKYISIFIMLWGVGTIFLLYKFPDALMPPFSFSSRIYGMIIPLLYLIYLKLKGKNFNDSVRNDISLMVATGFFFGIKLSAYFLLVYGIIFLLRRKSRLPYVVAAFPIVFVYYAILITTIVLFIRSGNENALPIPIVIGKP